MLPLDYHAYPFRRHIDFVPLDPDWGADLPDVLAGDADLRALVQDLAAAVRAVERRLALLEGRLALRERAR